MLQKQCQKEWHGGLNAEIVVLGRAQSLRPGVPHKWIMGWPLPATMWRDSSEPEEELYRPGD